jgi:hypothetical protein
MRSALHACRRLSLRCAPLLLIAALAACADRGTKNTPASAGPEAAPAAPTEPRMVGGDRDEHGCIASAGYLWCGREKRCVRPWELAKEAGFPDTADGFAAHCAAPQPDTKP